jgi:hypothetical protein
VVAALVVVVDEAVMLEIHLVAVLVTAQGLKNSEEDEINRNRVMHH